MRYIIIGYSVAAVNAIKSIRTLDNKGEILVFTDEEKLYSRPLISYYLAGKISENRLNFVEDNFENKYNVKVFFNTKVLKIDPKNKQIILDNKQKISFDKLLITTGGYPIIPKIKGLNDDTIGVFTFTKLKDAKDLIKYIKKNKIRDAVVLGGGLIGMKLIEGLIPRKINIKIIDLQDRLLANTLDNKASSYIEKKLANYNCDFIKEDTITEVKTKNKKLVSVKLKNKQLKTNLLIITIGVMPNIELVKDTDIKINRGILVNDYMQTNFDYIYAAGDVVESKNLISQENSIIAIWPKAAYEGKIAGLNMVNNKIKCKYFYPMNSVEILGIPTISFGITHSIENDKNYEIFVKEDKDSYKKIVIKDNKVVGVILVNCINRAGIYNLLINKGIDISNFKQELIKDDFGFLMLPKDFRKHLVNTQTIEI